MKIGAFGYFIKSHNPEELLIEIEKAKKTVKFTKEKQYDFNKEE